MKKAYTILYSLDRKLALLHTFTLSLAKYNCRSYKTVMPFLAKKEKFRIFYFYCKKTFEQVLTFAVRNACCIVHLPIDK